MNNTKKYFEWILLTIFFGGVLFYTNRSFVEKEVLAKEYIYIISSLLFGCVSFINNRQAIQLDSLSVVLVLFILYLTFISILSSPSVLAILTLIGFLFLIFFFKDNELKSKSMNWIIAGLCVLQAGYGLLQYFHLVGSSSSFSIVGSYDNPAGFAACLAVAFPLVFTMFGNSMYHNLLSMFSVVIIGGAVVLSESRASIISIMIVSVLFTVNQLPSRLRKYRRYILSILTIAVIIVFINLLFIKKNSATGRLLVWEVSLNMIKDNPILGGGKGYFLANYMEAQANYFTQYTDSKYAMLADNISHPFNEYLFLVVEYGIAGGLFLLIAVFLLIKSSKPSSPYMLCLISLGVCSLFSYPLKYYFNWVIVAYCVAQITRSNHSISVTQFSIPIWFKSLITMISVIGLFFLTKDIRFEYSWNRVARLSLLGKTDEMLPQYEKLHRSWNGNHLFLYNYGAELNHIKEYGKSLDIFSQCTQYWNDYDIQMIIADNHFKLEKWEEAEFHYHKASNMCPNRFAPLHRLHEIYVNRDERSKAISIAYHIIEKEVKIPSNIIFSIKTKMEEYIEENT